MDFGEPFGGVISGAKGAVLSALMRVGTPMTGRQLHRLVDDRWSLWSVQEALKELTSLGLVAVHTVGRAHVHAVNEQHLAVESLRMLVDPVAALEGVVRETVGAEVQAVLLFGSTARGEAAMDSDVDLVVLAPEGWDRRAEVVEAVGARLGNGCDVLVFTPEKFRALAAAGEPVVREILRDGVALIGSKPSERQLVI